MLKIKPNKKKIGAEVFVNVTKINSSQTFKIKKALNEYGMLYFRGQSLSSSDFLSFAKKFGVPAKSILD